MFTQKMQKTCSTVKGVLGSGKVVRITKPNGTDLTVRIEGRPVLISDGMISEEDLKAGYAACQVYLPAGEVFLAPIAGAAEGKVVVDRDFFGGQEVTGLTMIFKAGKMTSMSAKSGFERLKALYDAAGPGKDDFALIDIGVNPKLAEGAGARILNYVRAGMVTVGIGNNVWWSFLVFVPYLGALVMPWILAFKGNEWAWQNRRWESVEHFKRVQHTWMIWGLWITIAVTLIVTVILLFALGLIVWGIQSSGISW